MGWGPSSCNTCEIDGRGGGDLPVSPVPWEQKCSARRSRSTELLLLSVTADKGQQPWMPITATGPAQTRGSRAALLYVHVECRVAQIVNRGVCILVEMSVLTRLFGVCSRGRAHGHDIRHHDITFMYQRTAKKKHHAA